MSFIKYLIWRRNIIIILMCINCFALGVNILGIKGEIKDDQCPDHVTHHILSSGEYGEYGVNGEYGTQKFQNNFWPFVKFWKPFDTPYYCGVQSKKVFLGVFHYFDYSEFLVYSLIILLVFYMRWEYLRKQ